MGRRVRRSSKGRFYPELPGLGQKAVAAGAGSDRRLAQASAGALLAECGCGGSWTIRRKPLPGIDDDWPRLLEALSPETRQVLEKMPKDKQHEAIVGKIRILAVAHYFAYRRDPMPAVITEEEVGGLFRQRTRSGAPRLVDGLATGRDEALDVANVPDFEDAAYVAGLSSDGSGRLPSFGFFATRSSTTRRRDAS